MAHRVAPKGLRLQRAGLQFAPHHAHEPAEDGHEDDGEQRELPRYEDERSEVEDDEHGVLEEHVEARHDGVFYFLHVTTHAGDDVALAFFREEVKRQRRHLAIQLVANVSHHARTYGYDGGRRQKIGSGLEECHHGKEQSDDEQRGCRARVYDEFLHVIVHVVGQHLTGVAPVPCHELVGAYSSVHLKEYLENGYERSEGKDVEYGRENIEHHRHDEVALVRRHKPSEYL